jgi:hypothetical protein
MLDGVLHRKCMMRRKEDETEEMPKVKTIKFINGTRNQASNVRARKLSNGSKFSSRFATLPSYMHEIVVATKGSY